MMSTSTPPTRSAGPFGLLDFLRSESAGGFLLIVSGVAAMIWANSGAERSYHRLVAAPGVEFWVNDGLMTVFFLLVGLELRREMAVGELASPSRIAAPAVAAVGGMLVPAAIFSLFNYTDLVAMRGWAVPVATDIAFALAVLSVLGRRVPAALKVFLTALAIIDDLGAIVVIALFYSYSLDFAAMGLAVLLWCGMFGLSRIGVRMLWPYLIGGVGLWVLVMHAGIHPTLSGVALAFVVPRGADAPADRLEHGLEPWVAYLILPLFGLVNAGLSLSALPPDSWRTPLALGAALGLLLGKQAGVFGAVRLAARLKIAQLPDGVTTLQLYGGAALCGIGFTMSLFIADLAFSDATLENEVKLAVFAGSLISAAYGLVVLAIGYRTSRRSP